MSMTYKLSDNGEASTSHFIKLTLCKFLVFSIVCFSQSENGKLISHRILGKSKGIACTIWLSYIPGKWLVPFKLFSASLFQKRRMRHKETVLILYLLFYNSDIGIW